jgi:type II secretory pathway component PulC
MNSKRILLAGNLIVIALAFWMTASILLTWIAQRGSSNFLEEDVLGPHESRSAVPRQAKTLADYGLIAEKDVFHSGRVDQRTFPGEEAIIQVTERNLQLKGTVVGVGPRSYAVIVDHDSSKEDMYFQDDFVLGARIARILKNRVILVSNGKEEALLMTDEKRSLAELSSSAEAGPVSEATSSGRGVVPPRRSVAVPGQ